MNDEAFNNHYLSEIHNIVPSLGMHFIFGEPLYGEKNAALHYKKILEKYGAGFSFSDAFSSNTDKNIINLVLGIYPIKSEPSGYSYIFSQTSTKFLAFPKNWEKLKPFKGIFQVGENVLLPSVSLYAPQGGFYFTLPKTVYKRTSLSDATLFFCGAEWDQRYKKSLEILDSKDFFNWYGTTKLSLKKSYRGFSSNIVESLAQHKIALILHSKHHKENKEPSLRIFEAASVAAVIISDKHPFIMENFGDSVLYVDQDDSEEKIAQDIIKHYEWIKEHPSEALELAQRAHTIFVNKFTLEDQILRLINIHQQTLVADGLAPLPPRGKFSHFYYKDDLNVLNKMLQMLLPQSFSIKNFTNCCEENLFCLNVFGKAFSLSEDVKNKPFTGAQEIPKAKQIKEYRLSKNMCLVGLKADLEVQAYLLEWSEDKGFVLSFVGDELPACFEEDSAQATYFLDANGARPAARYLMKDTVLADFKKDAYSLVYRDEPCREKESKPSDRGRLKGCRK